MTFVRRTIPLTLLLMLSALGVVYGARLPGDYRCLRVVTGSNYGAGFDEANLRYALYDLGSGQYRRDPRANPPLRIATAPDGRHAAELERGADGSYTLWVRDAEGGAVRLQGGMAPAMILRSAGLLFGWSPDSSRIAYLWAARDGQLYLSTASADGSARQTALFTRLDGAAGLLFDLRVYGWSADNAVIAIAEGQADWTNRYSFWSAAGLRRIEPARTAQDAGASEPLYRGVWSPQGQTFAAIRTAAGAQALKLLSPASQGEIVVVDGLPGAPVELVAWSPDARYVVLVSYASVCGTPCATHWRYDFFDSSGARLQSNVIGARLAQGGISDMVTPPSGRVVTAAWFGGEWWFLTPSGELAALDVATGARRVIAEGVVSRYGDEMFYVSTWQRSRMRVVSNFTLLPDGDYALVPTEQGGKIRIERVSRAGRQTLVEDADTLFGENGARFWLWDGTWAAIPWSRRGEPTRLTLARLDTGWTQTIDGGYDTISSISPADSGWVGYIGRRGNERALELVNARTGERRKLLDSLGTHPFWEVSFSGDAAGVFVRSGRDALFRGLVYLAGPEGGAKWISSDAVNAPLWSPDGAGFALMRLNSTGSAILEVFTPDGGTRRQANLGPFLATQPALERWTRCD